MNRDFDVMAVDVSTSPSLTVGTPKPLFKLPQPLGNPLQGHEVSRDGPWFVFTMPPPARSVSI